MVGMGRFVNLVREIVLFIRPDVYASKDSLAIPEQHAHQQV